ncbi:uncharacterized membrane-anchored protein YitT (DUF2179 family) [Ulvibacter sp. MAR_2010_11]|uniref:YitT family protein n=1 Tax=Ulvibacter sp. MAR_2010_11 TaxID=1250229 RepID=UPI000C2BDD3D|nr:YitT family protein [Ulvibacter sp. MAR_2010_11]PKA83991.1 uncharacterized membrane-anchored protein YitT (DUF2179 family) [Ulvibacter sp. MAR_2010_11]
MKKIATLKLTKAQFLTELKSYTWVCIGSVLLSIAYVLFIIPHNVVPGGILGLSIVINEVTGISIGSVALLINIPLFLWGSKVLGIKNGIKTALSMVLISTCIDLFSLITDTQVFIDDILVSSLFGGVIIGLAVALVMNAGATTGGNDVLVQILMKKIKIPYSKLIFIIDGIVIAMGMFVFEDFTMAAYSIIAIIAIGKTIEYYIKQSVQNKTVLVFSKKNMLIQDELVYKKNTTNGILKLVHHDSNGKIILITKNKKNLATIESIIYKIDPDATISVLESNS